jgi:GWxTD domain-containing protein
MMTGVRSSFWAALVLGGVAVTAVAADKLDKDDKKWLEQVQVLIQPDEQQVFRAIPKADRAEFQTIFWARRNAKGPGASANEFQEQFLKSAAEAEKKFAVSGRSGAATDCARVFLLIGPPDSVRAVSRQTEGAEDDPMAAMRAMGRAPEIWTYKDRPGFTFKDGQIEIGFDERCALPPGVPLDQHLNDLAASRIVTADLKPEIGPNGRLVPLSELQKRRRSPAQKLLDEPRQDFAFEQQQKLSMRGQDGIYIAGLLRIPASGLTIRDEGGKKKTTLHVATQLLDVDGKPVRTVDNERVAEVGADGNVVVSYATMGAPGAYNLRIAVVDPASGKGSLKDVPLVVPDYNSAGLKLTELQVLSGIEDVQQPDPKDALADFVMGQARLHPRFGNVFRRGESLNFLGLGYNAQSDPATGKASVTSRFEVFKVDKKVMASPDQTYDTPIFSPLVGPVPLSTVEPGLYRVKLTVIDNVAKKELTKIAPYEVAP